MPNILIADDEPRVVQGLRREFEAKGFAVDATKDGSDAWARLQEMPGFYDVVLTDVMMPEMDGFELLHQMRRDNRFQTLPVVVMRFPHSDWLEPLWAARSVPYVWGDERWEGGEPSGEPFEAYNLFVYKTNRPGIFAAVDAARARYLPSQTNTAIQGSEIARKPPK